MQKGCPFNAAATYVFDKSGISNSCPRTPENALVGAPWTSCWSWEGRFGRRSCLHGRNETCQERRQPLRYYRQLFMFVRQVSLRWSFSCKLNAHTIIYTPAGWHFKRCCLKIVFFLVSWKPTNINKHQDTSSLVWLGCLCWMRVITPSLTSMISLAWANKCMFNEYVAFTIIYIYLKFFECKYLLLKVFEQRKHGEGPISCSFPCPALVLCLIPECVAKGSRFTLAVWGRRSVRSRLLCRSQPFASVRIRPRAFTMRTLWHMPVQYLYGDCRKRCHFWWCETSHSVVLYGRRGTLWYLHVSNKVSKVVLCERRNTFVRFSEDDLQFS